MNQLIFPSRNRWKSCYASLITKVRDSPKQGRKGAAPFCKQRNNLICACAYKEGAVARRGARKMSYLVRMRELRVCDGV